MEIDEDLVQYRFVLCCSNCLRKILVYRTLHRERAVLIGCKFCRDYVTIIAVPSGPIQEENYKKTVIVDISFT